MIVDKTTLPIEGNTLFHIPFDMSANASGETFADADGVELHIHCLSHNIQPRLSVNNIKNFDQTKPGFSTYEVRYNLGRCNFAIFLILATDNNEKYELFRSGINFTLNFGGKTIFISNDGVVST